MGAITLESSLAISTKFDKISFDPAFPFLEIYPIEMCAQVHQELCTKIRAVFLKLLEN